MSKSERKKRKITKSDIARFSAELDVLCDKMVLENKDMDDVYSDVECSVIAYLDNGHVSKNTLNHLGILLGFEFKNFNVLKTDCLDFYKMTKKWLSMDDESIQEESRVAQLRNGELVIPDGWKPHQKAFKNIARILTKEFKNLVDKFEKRDFLEYDFPEILEVHLSDLGFEKSQINNAKTVLLPFYSETKLGRDHSKKLKQKTIDVLDMLEFSNMQLCKKRMESEDYSPGWE